MNPFANLSDAKPRKLATGVGIVCGFLLVLPSCIPDLRQPTPGPKLPDAFNGVADPENSAQLTVEAFFGDPMLTGLIHQALLGNQELRILAEDVQIASNEILARIGQYQPSISPGGSIGMDRFSNYSLEGAGIRNDPYLPRKFLPNPLPEYLIGFLLYWTPDVWWQLHNARDAAAMRYFAAGEGRKYVVTSVVAEIADNYYALIALDKRLENLDIIIALQEQSQRVAELKMRAGQGNDLAVQRFQAEVRKNQSERLIVQQDIIQVENRINFLSGRFPQTVTRASLKAIEDYIDLNLQPLGVGVPAQLLENRPDIRRAERELAATGLDVTVAKKNFYPKGYILAGVGTEAFDPRFLFLTPEALAARTVGNMLVPLINRKAIKAEYFTANARQLQAVYNYQRTVLNAFTEVVNRLSRVQKYLNSIEVKKQQVRALERSVDDATKLYQSGVGGIEYIDVLFAQRDLWQARRELIDTKREQLSAVVNTYQALGGGAYLSPVLFPKPMQPHHHRWHLFHHSKGSQGPVVGPPIPPAPPEAEGSPAPPSAPPKPESGEELAPTPASGGLPEPLPTPAEGGRGSETVPGTDKSPRR